MVDEDYEVAIYYLRDPRLPRDHPDGIFYVGKSEDWVRRERGYNQKLTHRDSNQEKVDRIYEIRDSGYRIELTVIAYCTYESYPEVEHYYIEAYRLAGYNLLNKADPRMPIGDDQGLYGDMIQMIAEIRQNYVPLYNDGRSLNEVTSLINDEYQLDIPQGTVRDWLFGNTYKCAGGPYAERKLRGNAIEEIDRIRPFIPEGPVNYTQAHRAYVGQYGRTMSLPSFTKIAKIIEEEELYD